MPIDKLTEELFEEYGNKRLNIVVDTENYEAYAVPKNVERMNFLRTNFGRRGSTFVPMHIDLNSSYEIKAIIVDGMGHTEEQRTIAYQRALEIVAQGEFSTADDCNYKYVRG